MPKKSPKAESQPVQSDSQPDKKKPGCFRRLLSGVVALSLIAVIVIVAVSMLGGDDNDDNTPTPESSDVNTQVLQGEVLIMNTANFEVTDETCHGIGSFEGVAGGAILTVTVRDQEPVETTLSQGALSPEGNCQLQFTANIPDGDWATFEIGSQTGEQRMVKEGADEFRDGSSADDWWVSVQYDTDLRP